MDLNHGGVEGSVSGGSGPREPRLPAKAEEETEEVQGRLGVGITESTGSRGPQHLPRAGSPVWPCSWPPAAAVHPTAAPPAWPLLPQLPPPGQPPLPDAVAQRPVGTGKETAAA